MALSEQEVIRRDARRELVALGVDPYPAAAFAVTHLTQQVREGFTEATADQWTNVRLAGRLMLKRVMGKAAFVELQDAAGRLQLYLKRDALCPGDDKTLYDTVFRKLLDLGDFIGVRGFAFITKTGELSLHVEELKLLSKSLRPLPVVREKDGATYDAFTDPEQRYRMRYVDLVVNPKVRRTFVARTRIVQSLRQFMAERGYLEVETPVLQPLYGGAAARPFTTLHHTLDQTLYLRISNELYLKRLIVGGYDGVFEFSRNFRNEGMDRKHNPEFTCLELYVAYQDYEWMMGFTEAMLAQAVTVVHGQPRCTCDGRELDFTPPWPRLTMTAAIAQHAGVDITGLDTAALQRVARDLGVPTDPTMGPGKLIDELFSAKVQDHLVNPTFITDYPLEMSPLAKKHRAKPGLVERFEVFCAGMEICNAFSELNDPVDQRERFAAQAALRAKGDDEAMVLDEDFLRALEYGMPPTAGLGVGIDRVVMLLTDSRSIQDVLFFPQMRPEQDPAAAPAASPGAASPGA